MRTWCDRERRRPASVTAAFAAHGPAASHQHGPLLAPAGSPRSESVCTGCSHLARCWPCVHRGACTTDIRVSSASSSLGCSAVRTANAGAEAPAPAVAPMTVRSVELARGAFHVKHSGAGRSVLLHAHAEPQASPALRNTRRVPGPPMPQPVADLLGDDVIASPALTTRTAVRPHAGIPAPEMASEVFHVKHAWHEPPAATLRRRQSNRGVQGNRRYVGYCSSCGVAQPGWPRSWPVRGPIEASAREGAPVDNCA